MEIIDKSVDKSVKVIYQGTGGRDEKGYSNVRLPKILIEECGRDVEKQIRFSRTLRRLWSLLFEVVLYALSAFSNPVVQTPLGDIHGYFKVSELGRRYAAFEGIPYAQAPMGKLRFEDPVAITAPFGQLNATKKSGVCAQYYDVPPGKDGQPGLEDALRGTEDCLYLNIYAPELKDPKKLMPVIFFIHGGAFQYGSGNDFGNKFLADRDVIFVTINYRLGSLGFLSTEDEVVPGNMGLKDQNMALRWIFQFIKYFRGDPSRIVLVGSSAGSSSIQYHYLSHLSRGLFSSSIAMSGTSFNPWAFAYGAKQKAKQLGALFQCPTTNSREMINCLKKVPTLKLVQATKEFQVWQHNPEAPWAPVVDIYNPQPFLSVTPKDILDSKLLYDVPAVFGVVSDEGSDPVADYATHANLMKELNDNWVSIAPFLLDYNYTLPISRHKEVAVDSRREYFDGTDINNSTVFELDQLISDQKYLIGFENGIRLQAAASQSPVYMYYYSFRGSQSCSDHLRRTRNSYGACHADDMKMVVENADMDPTKTKEEWKMSNFLMDMWTSVAYYGVPRLRVDWQPVDASNPELTYLHIAAPKNYSMSGSKDLGRKSFWKEFFFTV